MLRILKTLLLWLLLAALPLQGIAAAAMMSCRAVQHISIATAPVVMHSDSGTGMHAHHQHGHQHQHHHALDSIAVMHDDASSPHVTEQHSHGKHDASTSCSACAACCLSIAALPFSLDWNFVHNTSEPVVITPSPLATGYIPDGIERPPRTHLNLIVA